MNSLQRASTWQLSPLMNRFSIVNSTLLVTNKKDDKRKLGTFKPDANMHRDA